MCNRLLGEGYREENPPVMKGKREEGAGEGSGARVGEGGRTIKWSLRYHFAIGAYEVKNSVEFDAYRR